MRNLSPAMAQCHAEYLRKVVQHAYGDSNEALAVLADDRHPAIRCATQADFRYADPDAVDGATRTLPIVQFHRQYALCLESMELTLYGYCIHRQFGWERKNEAAFSLRRPAFWRRMLRPAPLLALKVKAEQSGASISIAAALRGAYSNKVNHTVRLDPELQQQLAQVNTEQIAARSITTRLSAWFGRLRNKHFRK